MFTDITEVIVELLHIQLSGFGCICKVESHSFFSCYAYNLFSFIIALRYTVNTK